MAFQGLLRWTAHKCRRICCRNSFPLNGFLPSQQRAFSLGGSSGITLLGSSSSRGRSGCGLVLLRDSSEKLLNARVYSSTTGVDKEASSSSSAEDNDDPSNLDTDEAYTLYLSDEDLDSLTEGDPEMIKKVRHIQLEHEIFLQEGLQVPSGAISLDRWQELLSKPNVHQRKKFYSFLFKLEHMKRNEQIKKKILREQREEYLNALPVKPALGEDEDGMIYGLNRNTLFLRLRDQREYGFYENRLIQAMKFGPVIVIDCGFDHCMTTKENKYCSNQIELAFAWNRLHPRPFDLHLCNLQQGTILEKSLSRKMPTLYAPANPFNVTKKSYLDFFPKERLVYLTPHTREDLVEFDEDEVYIIGGIVDMGDSRPYSAAKAKKEGIRMKKLPLDQYLQWGQGGKSLTLDQMVKILLDANYHKSWDKAFKHVPRRKLFNPYGDDDATHNNDPAPQTRAYPPTFLTRTSPKTIYYDDEGRDLRKYHNVNRVNVIETTFSTDRDRYQRPERSHYNQNSISNNFSKHNYSNFEEDNVRRGSSYKKKIQNSRCTESDESQQSKMEEFNVKGFSNPKRSSNSRKVAEVNVDKLLNDTS